MPRVVLKSDEKCFRSVLPKATIIKGEHDCYSIIDVMAQGGFGIVYAATALGSGRSVVVKELMPEDVGRRFDCEDVVEINEASMGKYARAIRDFYQEAQVLRLLATKGVPVSQLLDFAEQGGTAYQVLKPLEGDTIEQLVARRGKLPCSEACDLIAKVAEIIKRLHNLGVYHLDLAPDNIIVTPDGPVVIDFASAFVDGVKKVNAVCCSDGFAAEEVYFRIIAPAPRADVYSLGATLLYMLSAVEPPRADCISDKVVERLLPAEVSPSVRAAVMGAMQRKSKHRLPSAEAFANVLAGGDADAYCDKGWWHGVLSKCCFKY